MKKLTNWATPSTPDNFEAKPWLHPAVVDYMEHLIRPDWIVLEHGCGGSTLWFAERAQEVVSVDSDAAWFAAVSDLAPDNVTMYHDLHEMLIADARVFDLVLVDGVGGERRTWLLKAHQLVKPDGWLVWDNCNRPTHQRERNYLKSACEYSVFFDTNPPGFKHAVTEFYRLP